MQSPACIAASAAACSAALQAQHPFCCTLPAPRSALTEEVERLRGAATSLGREKAERDVELGEALTKVSRGH